LRAYVELRKRNTPVEEERFPCGRGTFPLWKRSVSPGFVAGTFTGKVKGQDITVSVQPGKLVFINFS
jgi:hypothetical protein